MNVLAGIALGTVAMPDRAHGTTEAKPAAFSVSVGTLDPASDSETGNHTITGLSNSNNQITVTPTPASGFNVSIWVGR